MKRFFTPLLFTLAIAGCSKSSPLHDSMEDMGKPFKAMQESNDLATIQAELSTFTQALNVAKVQKVKAEHQADFDEGIKKLADATAQAEQAVAAGNLEQAKALVQQMADLRKEFHEKLGVKKK